VNTGVSRESEFENFSRVISSIAGYALPKDLHATVLLKNGSERFVGSTAHHEQIHVLLNNTTFLGFLTSIIHRTLAQKERLPLPVATELALALRKLMELQIEVHEGVATFAQSLFVRGGHGEEGLRIFHSELPPFYAEQLAKVSMIADAGRVRVADIENVVLTIAQASMNTDCLLHLKERPTMEGLLPLIFQSASFDANRRFAIAIQEFANGSKVAAFNKMVYDNTPPFGRYVIDKCLDDQGKLRPGSITPLKIQELLGPGEPTMIRIRASLQVKDGAIFAWMNENIFPVFIGTQDNIRECNEIIDATKDALRRRYSIVLETPHLAQPVGDEDEWERVPRKVVFRTSARSNVRAFSSGTSPIDASALSAFIDGYLANGRSIVSVWILGIDADNICTLGLYGLTLQSIDGQDHCAVDGVLIVRVHQSSLAQGLDSARDEKVLLFTSNFDVFASIGADILQSNPFFFVVGSDFEGVIQSISGTADDFECCLAKDEITGMHYIVARPTETTLFIVGYATQAELMKFDDKNRSKVVSPEELFAPIGATETDIQMIFGGLRQIGDFKFDDQH
jgi:hypothetical protein